MRPLPLQAGSRINYTYACDLFLTPPALAGGVLPLASRVLNPVLESREIIQSRHIILRAWWHKVLHYLPRRYSIPEDIPITVENSLIIVGLIKCTSRPVYLLDIAFWVYTPLDTVILFLYRPARIILAETRRVVTNGNYVRRIYA